MYEFSRSSVLVSLTKPLSLWKLLSEFHRILHISTGPNDKLPSETFLHIFVIGDSGPSSGDQVCVEVLHWQL